MNKLPGLIEERRIRKGLNRSQMASIVGIHRNTYYDIESGKTKNPYFISLAKILTCLEIDLPMAMEWYDYDAII